MRHNPDNTTLNSIINIRKDIREKIKQLKYKQWNKYIEIIDKLKLTEKFKKIGNVKQNKMNMQEKYEDSETQQEFYSQNIH